MAHVGRPYEYTFRRDLAFNSFTRPFSQPKYRRAVYGGLTGILPWHWAFGTYYSDEAQLIDIDTLRWYWPGPGGSDARSTIWYQLTFTPDLRLSQSKVQWLYDDLPFCHINYAVTDLNNNQQQPFGQLMWDVSPHPPDGPGGFATSGKPW